MAAALLHDVGHLLELDDGDGSRRPGGDDHGEDAGHELTGATWLVRLFPASVIGPIALHVRAKRYLCATDPDYRESLSVGSTRSLYRQGGPLSRLEALAFEASPGFHAGVGLRRWDDRGKEAGTHLPPFDHYRDIVIRVHEAES